LPQRSNKVIHDNLYGRVECSSLEMAIIKSATFGRLSRIQQLGLCSWVFPGASHTRAAHSIGVMHAAGRLAKHLGLEEDEVELLRLGGLLHDIGQYPLSHCIELVYRAIGDPTTTSEIFENPEVLTTAETEAPLLQRLTKMRPSTGEAKDKSVGGRIVVRRPEILGILSAAGKGGDFVEDLAEIVTGTQPDSLHQQIMNSEYDCDRLDYVRRDSRAAGVDYGYFDFEFLVENFVLQFDPPTSTNRIAAIEESKGLAALEQYLLARYNMYSQIVFHKTVRSLELLARAAYLGLAEAGKVFPDYRDVTAAAESSDRYLEFDDSYFWARLAEFQDDTSVPAEVRSIIQRVLRRQPLKLAFEYKTISDRGADPSYGLLLKLTSHQAQLKSVADEAGIDVRTIVIDVVPAVEFVPGEKDIPADQFQRYREDAKAGLVGESELLRSIQLAPRVWDGRKTRLMTSRPGSLLGQMIGKRLYMIRFYLLDGNADDAQRLAMALTRWSQIGVPPSY